MFDVDDDLLPLTRLFLDAVGVAEDDEEQQSIEEAEETAFWEGRSDVWGRWKELRPELLQERQRGDLEADLLAVWCPVLHSIKPTPPPGRTPFSYDNNQDYTAQSRRHMLRILQDDQEFNRRRQAVTA